jgi:hypothetical protein
MECEEVSEADMGVEVGMIFYNGEWMPMGMD